MTKEYLAFLTYEQKEKFHIYRDKWIQIGRSTNTNRSLSEDCVSQIFSLFKSTIPQSFLWIDDPIKGMILSQDRDLENPSFGMIGTLGRWVAQNLKEIISEDVWIQVWSEVSVPVAYYTRDLIHSQIALWIRQNFFVDQADSLRLNSGKIVQKPRKQYVGYHELSWLSFCDFLQDVGGLDLSLINGFLQLAKYCGWWWPNSDQVILCPKPSLISLDEQGRLHRLGEPALSYDNSKLKIFAWHGIQLPEWYGSVHANQWQVSWLLDEKNFELRRILLQGIGYRRILEELSSAIVDTWKEYQLLEIPYEIDVEPIFLLKIIDPFADRFFVLRVPPNLSTARDAILWVNWGIDPEDFALET